MWLDRQELIERWQTNTQIYKVQPTAQEGVRGVSLGQLRNCSYLTIIS